MMVKRSNNYAHTNIQDIEWGSFANEWTENAKENKIHRQRKLPRQRNSTERILSSYFPHFPAILITLLLLSSTLPDVLKAEHALVVFHPS